MILALVLRALQFLAQALDVADQFAAWPHARRDVSEIGIRIHANRQHACVRQRAQGRLIGRAPAATVGKHHDVAARGALRLIDMRRPEPTAVDELRRRRHDHPGQGERRQKSERRRRFDTSANRREKAARRAGDEEDLTHLRLAGSIPQSPRR